ncbi:MAG: c-type cytochrome, partial [Burkholderiaceae bacterium]
LINPERNTRQMATQLQSAGAPVTVHFYPRTNHVTLLGAFAAQKRLPNQFKADSAKVLAGAKIADAVLCPMCHLGGFSGQNEIPRVAGMNYEYVVKQLQDFKHRRRTNDAGNMTAVAGTLSDQDIDNLAHYITTLN